MFRSWKTLLVVTLVSAWLLRFIAPHSVTGDAFRVGFTFLVFGFLIADYCYSREKTVINIGRSHSLKLQDGLMEAIKFIRSGQLVLEQLVITVDTCDLSVTDNVDMKAFERLVLDTSKSFAKLNMMVCGWSYAVSQEALGLGPHSEGE